VQIAGFLKTSLVEWPGKVVAVIFTPGCNFCCPFCHNPELVNPEQIKKQSLFKEIEVLADLKKRKKWLDGVVVTGGEPTLQPDLSVFLDKIHRLGFLTMIETNGSQPEVLKKLINQKKIDFAALDVKGTFKEYERYTGVDNSGEAVLKSLNLVVKGNINVELRTTVVPGLHDGAVLIKIAQEIQKTVPNDRFKRSGFRWVLQNFQTQNCLDPAFKKLKPYSKIEMVKFQKAIKKTIPGVELRN